MTILMAILTVLSVFFLGRWLVSGRPEAPAHVQRLPDGSVPDFDRQAPAVPTSPPEQSPAATAEPDAPTGDGVDATDVVRSGSSVSPTSAASEDGAADTADDVEHTA